MILYPGLKESLLVLLDQFSNPSQVCVLESVILPKSYGRQKDNHAPLILRHMDVSGLMIVWINRYIVAMFLPVEQFNQSDNLGATPQKAVSLVDHAWDSRRASGSKTFCSLGGEISLRPSCLCGKRSLS